VAGVRAGASLRQKNQKSASRIASKPHTLSFPTILQSYWPPDASGTRLPLSAAADAAAANSLLDIPMSCVVRAMKPPICICTAQRHLMDIIVHAITGNCTLQLS